MEDSISKAASYIIGIIAVFFTLFHLYTAMFGSFPPYLQRPIHLAFGAVLAFLINEVRRDRNKCIIWIANTILSVTAFFIFVYFIWKYEAISEWIPFVSEFGDTDFIVGVIATVLLLEATRRVAGLPLAIVVAVFVLYGRFGSYFPGVFRHVGYSWRDIIEFLYFGYNGVYGMAIGVSATFIAIFIIFGCFFEKAGGGHAIINFGKFVFGNVRGGPAKIAVVTSALFGIISGSGVANVYATGNLSIPLMKKLGYRPSFAGAVEACASTGGQLMPPVMGAAAFVMAEITGVPYTRIMLAALLPAFLYFASIFFMVDFEAAQLGISGVPRKDLPTFREIKKYVFYSIPLAVLVGTLMYGYSIMRAGLFATIAVIVVSWIHKEFRLTPGPILETLSLAGKRTVMLAVATADAGIVIGIVTLTGLGLNFVGLVMSFSGELVIVGVFLTAIATLILGMGLASVVAYIIVAAISIPALRALGFELLPCHMFAFYFSIVSMISPPVAPSALAASEIAGSSFFRTGLAACKLGVVAFIIPFVFLYSPELLMHGNIWQVTWAAAIALSAVIALSAGVHGWFLMRLNGMERCALLAGAFLLICHRIINVFSSNINIVVGFIILLLSISWLIMKHRNPPVHG